MTVYFVQAGENGPVKIGWSGPDKLRLRLEKMQTYNAESLSLIREEDGGRDLERFFHKEFRSLWIRGEWYKFAPVILTLPAIMPQDNRVPIIDDRMTGDELLDALVSLNISQTVFARQMEYHQSSVSKWISGESLIPRHIEISIRGLMLANALYGNGLITHIGLARRPNARRMEDEPRISTPWPMLTPAQKVCAVCGGAAIRTAREGQVNWSRRRYCSEECRNRRPRNSM